MTNFDPGGFLLLLTLLPSVVAGAVSNDLALLSARLGYGRYERNVVLVLGALIVGWIGVALVVETGLLRILAVVLAMAGALAATRNVRASSYGWVLGVILLFGAFAVLSAFGINRGVDRNGVPRDVISRTLFAFYAGGLFVFGAVGGAVVQSIRRGWYAIRER